MIRKPCVECGEMFDANTGTQKRCNVCRFSTPQARWKDIPGYEGRYQINPAGQIMNIKHSPSRLLHPTPRAKRGYAVSLHAADGVRTKHLVQRLLLLTFCPIDTPEMYFASPTDGDFFNTRLKNWTWVSRWYDHHKTLTPDSVRGIREVLANTPEVSYHALGTQYGISAMQVYRIARGEQWKDVK